MSDLSHQCSVTRQQNEYARSLKTFSRNARLPFLMAAFLALIAITGCGRDVAGNVIESVSPVVSAVALSCSPTIMPGATTQCTATVQGSDIFDSTVSWTTSGGAISQTGLLTAPASPGLVTVTATSTQDPAKLATTTVTVQSPQPAAPSISSIVIACSPTVVRPKATAQCTATVQGTGSYSSAVQWSASGGTINAAGLFTAPASTGAIMVIATSTQDPTRSAEAALAVQSAPPVTGTTAPGAPITTPTAPAPPTTPSTPIPVTNAPLITSVVTACNPAAVNPNATSQCVATVQGTGSYSSAVRWSTSRGAISASGRFTAPAATGAVTITATSTQDPSKSAMTTVMVTAQSVPSAITAVALACNPSPVAAGATSQCHATVQGTGSYNSAVRWSANPGAINSAGLFTAPATAAVVVVTATSMQDPSKSGSTTVTVQSATPTITSVAAACNPSTVAPGATSQCSAIVHGTGGYSTAVRWSASAGAISASGLFSAPNAPSTVTITATSTQDATKSGSATIAIQSQQPGVPQSKHVVIVMEENDSYSNVIGSGSPWPNLNNLAANGALPTNYFASTHPSIGNYLTLTTGQILTNNDNSTTVWNVDNLARRMLAANVSFRIYAEGITQGYVGGNTGLYLIRHNPFALLSDIAYNTQVADQHLFPFTQFAADLANGTLPEFSFIVPDVNDDAHNGTPQQADNWLQSQVVSPLSGNPAFAPGGDGILFVDFDEAATSDTRYGGGQVACVLWGPNVKVGYTQTSSTVYQHPSVLRTVMESLQLPNPPGAAANAPSMTEFFK